MYFEINIRKDPKTELQTLNKDIYILYKDIYVGKWKFYQF